MLKKIETVLVGTSLSEASDEVVRNGVRLAAASGARVYLVYASAPAMTYSAPFLPLQTRDEVLHIERAQIEAALQDQIRRLEIPPAQIAGASIEVGAPHRVLMDMARWTGADLVVVGAVERPAVAKLFGSTADRLLRKADRPLLATRGTLAVPPRRALVPVDLSPLSEEVFRSGLHLLEALGSGPETVVEALFVVTEPHREMFRERGQENAEQQAARALDRFLEANATGAGGDLRGAIAEGFVDQVILARIEETAPDLAILGTHGAGGFERFVVGSVAATVASHSPGSVLVIPPQAAREEGST